MDSELGERAVGEEERRGTQKINRGSSRKVERGKRMKKNLSKNTCWGFLLNLVGNKEARRGEGRQN